MMQSSLAQGHTPCKGFSRGTEQSESTSAGADGGKSKPFHRRKALGAYGAGGQRSSGAKHHAGGSDAAAQRGAVEPGRAASPPGLLVLLGQQQHEGHGQGAVVEAVHVGVVPLLQRGKHYWASGCRAWGFCK